MQRFRLVSFVLLVGASAVSPSDNDNHRNLRLLPLNDCGVDVSSNPHQGNVTTLGEYPWTALLGYEEPGNGFYVDSKTLNFGCGGTLISRRYVLTASHCIKGRPVHSPKLVAVRLGEWDLGTDEDCINDGVWCSDPPLDMGVEEVIGHPNYDFRARENDIALIRLHGLAPDRSSFIQPICLPIGNAANRVYNTGDKLIVSGWGYRRVDESSTKKLKAIVPVMDQAKCQEVYNNLKVNIVISDGMLCAGAAQERSYSCIGDSGGPLMVYESDPTRIVMAGMLSFGPTGCSAHGIPEVYVRISSYVTWILDNIRS